MIGEQTWPELTLERRNGACDVHLNTPGILWEVLGNAIKAVFVECSFITINEALDLGVLGVTCKLPILQLLHMILLETLESLVRNDFAERRVFHTSLWYSEILLQLVDDVGEAVKFRNRLWLHDDAKLLIDDLGFFCAREQYLIEFTRE